MISARSTKQSLRKGFTLIELLVVLGILGILATALVATIDPFEQLKKAADSNAKNAAVEVVNASLRYFTTHNAMPWANPADGGVTGCGNGTTGVVSGARLDSTAGAACIEALIDDGELKTQFTSSTTITNQVYISGTDNATTKTATACFLATSKSQQRDPGTLYDSAGVARAAGICGVNGTAPDTCYWCATL